MFGATRHPSQLLNFLQAAGSKGATIHGAWSPKISLNMQQKDHNRFSRLQLFGLLVLMGQIYAVQTNICLCQTCNFADRYVKAANQNPRRNVAVNKQTTASTIYNNSGEESGPTCLAVDGNSDTTWRPINLYKNNASCFQTDRGDMAPWWQVDLGRRYTVASMTVNFRGDVLPRIAMTTVKVDQAVCFQFSATQSYPASNHFYCTSPAPLTGQHVRLEKYSTGLAPDPLGVCEVKVWVCWPGYYGHDCSHECTKKVCSDGRICSPVDGTCQNLTTSGQTVTTEDGCSPLLYLGGALIFLLNISAGIAAGLRARYMGPSEEQGGRRGRVR